MVGRPRGCRRRHESAFGRGRRCTGRLTLTVNLFQNATQTFRHPFHETGRLFLVELRILVKGAMLTRRGRGTVTNAHASAAFPIRWVVNGQPVRLDLALSLCHNLFLALRDPVFFACLSQQLSGFKREMNLARYASAVNVGGSAGGT
jgi:hypothetical protein